MADTVGAYILQRLRSHGVRQVYGYPGDGINGILGGFHEHGQEIEFIQAAHEELAAFMACAHAKFSGDVGVCLATSGPGAIHLLNGLYDAKLDHQPVVAIVGQQKTISLGGHYQQEVDLVSLFKDVASEYVQMVVTSAQVTHGPVGDVSDILEDVRARAALAQVAECPWRRLPQRPFCGRGRRVHYSGNGPTSVLARDADGLLGSAESSPNRGVDSWSRASRPSGCPLPTCNAP